MKDKKRKFKAPTWKEDNSLSNLRKMYARTDLEEVTRRMKINNDLGKTLKKMGWKYWDSCCIVENGYHDNESGFTFTYFKENVPTKSGRLYFSWHYDSQCGPYFYVGQLRASHGIYPRGTWSTYACIEYYPIMDTNIHQLPALEKMAIDAMNTQTELPLEKP